MTQFNPGKRSKRRFRRSNKVPAITPGKGNKGIEVKREDGTVYQQCRMFWPSYLGTYRKGVKPND